MVRCDLLHVQRSRRALLGMSEPNRAICGRHARYRGYVRGLREFARVLDRMEQLDVVSG
jgi:hypothetical protein